MSRHVVSLVLHTDDVALFPSVMDPDEGTTDDLLA